MQNKKVLYMQALSIPYTLITFYSFSTILGAYESFLFSFVFYWIYMIVCIYLVLKKTMGNKYSIGDMLGSTKQLLYSALNFIPVVGVFFVAFLPVISEITILFGATALALAIFNSFFEEVFWRGLCMHRSSPGYKLPIVLTSAVFALNHGAFLLLDFQYQGGALNLMGGPFVMGMLWLFLARKTSSIRFGIFAHLLVNFFAFTSLLTHNL